MALNFNFSQTGNSHFAQIAGTAQAKFFVGKDVPYEGNRGLSNNSPLTGFIYRAADYRQKFGFWADFIAPTAQAESMGSFFCLNSYDRAAFTFGFMQFAAHVPNGDFVKYFKKLLALGNAAEYFPKLALKNSRIHYKNSDGSLTQLESDASTQALMNYLNPDLKTVENQELICAARMVHWAMNDAEHRRIQVETAIDHFKKNMKSYAATYNLGNAPAKICLLVCDIRHQGRAKPPQLISEALDTGGDYDKAFENLLKIGSPKYNTRIDTLRAEIKKLENAGLLNKKYKKSTGEFV